MHNPRNFGNVQQIRESALRPCERLAFWKYMVQPQTPPCIVALDYAESDAMFAFLDQVTPESLPWVKIGLQMYCKYGPSLVEEVGSRGYKIFLDLKLHDIPNTVAGAIKSLANLPIHMLTLHASGGPEMMARAAEVQRDLAPDLRLLAVTVLTSMNAEQLASLGVVNPVEAQVLNLVGMANDSGVSGIVCSANEVDPIRAKYGDIPYLVTPGIRPAGGDLQDQKRAMTPGKAALLGSNALVVGRPITQAPDPAAACLAIQKEIEEALGTGNAL